MALIGPNEFKNGITIQVEHRLCTILEFQHVKMQMRAPTIKTRLRDIKTGQVLEMNFRQGDKFDQVYMETRKMQFMYADGDVLVFLDLKDYDEKRIAKTIVGDTVRFIPENAEVPVNFLEGEPMSIELPLAMTLAVRDTEAGIKGDRVSGATKKATLETGHEVHVPLFINAGDRLRIDTRSGAYIGKE